MLTAVIFPLSVWLTCKITPVMFTILTPHTGPAHPLLGPPPPESRIFWSYWEEINVGLAEDCNVSRIANFTIAQFIKIFSHYSTDHLSVRLRRPQETEEKVVRLDQETSADWARSMDSHSRCDVGRHFSGLINPRENITPDTQPGISISLTTRQLKSDLKTRLVRRDF